MTLRNRIASTFALFSFTLLAIIFLLLYFLTRRYTHNEFFIGTHPLDPDTDNGGENDGSEYFAGRIPQDYPADDGILPPTGVGWPGAGQLWLTFDNPPRVASFGIRAT